MRKFGYARVSTSQQSLEVQKKALLKEGPEYLVMLVVEQI